MAETTIEVTNSLTAHVVELALPALAQREVYQRAGSLVHVVRDPRLVDGVTLPVGAPRIRVLPRILLKNHLEMAATWIKTQTSEERTTTHSVDPPSDVVSAIFELGEWPHVRELKGIAHWPVVSPSGIAMRDGYDPASRYILRDVPLLDPLPSNPTREDAADAARDLLELVSDFPIESDAGRAAWLAGILTLLARPSIAGPVPAIIADAPIQGAGKTLLMQLIAMVVTGDLAQVHAAPDDNAEWNRMLLAVLLAGEPVVFFDNLKGRVDARALEAALTSTKFSDRKLKTSESVTVDVQALFLLSANNAEISVDLARRSLHCRIVPAAARPELRGGFKNPRLLEYARHHRGRLLRAALIILHAYRAAGSPPITMRPMGGFEAWSDAVRAPLVWAGCADPAETQDSLRELAASDDADDKQELLEAWHAFFGDQPATVKAALKVTDGSLATALSNVCDGKPPTPRLVGAQLAKLRDRIVAGYRLQEVKPKGSDGTRWLVVAVGGGP